MNKVIVITALVGLLSLGIFVDPLIPISLMLLFGLFVVVNLLIEKQKMKRLLEEKINDKIWDIPVVIDCGDRSCNHSHQIDFSLNTHQFVCDKCGKINKISISFIAIPKYE